MCVIIATKEELTNNVLVGLRHTLNVLLDKCIYAFPTLSAVSNLHWMLMGTDMNGGSLGGLLSMHVEDFCIA